MLNKFVVDSIRLVTELTLAGIIHRHRRKPTNRTAYHSMRRGGLLGREQFHSFFGLCGSILWDTGGRIRTEGWNLEYRVCMLSPQMFKMTSIQNRGSSMVSPAFCLLELDFHLFDIGISYSSLASLPHLILPHRRSVAQTFPQSSQSSPNQNKSKR